VFCDKLISYILMDWFGLWWLTLLSTIFLLYRGGLFYWWWKPPTCGKLQTICIT